MPFVGQIVEIVEQVVVLTVDFVRAFLHPFALTFDHEEAVFGSEDATAATAVAGAEFEEVDVLDVLVFHFLQKFGDVVDVIDGQIAARAQHFGLPACKRVCDAGLRQPVETRRLVTHLVFTGLDNSQHLAIQIVHIDHARYRGLLLAHGTFDGGDFSGTRRHIKNADVLFFYPFFSQTFLDIFGGHVKWSLHEVNVIDQNGEFHLDKAHNGRAE